MDKIRIPSSICIYNIRKWTATPRIYILGILLVIFVYFYVSPIINFSSSVGYRVTPWAFPYFTDFVITQLLMMLGIVFLFCDAPFTDLGYPYFLIRSGRISWAVGQVFYIMLGTAIYFLFIVLISMLILLPNIFPSFEWGKVLSTLAQTNVGPSFNLLLPINEQIQFLYTPIQALGFSLLLEWCAGTILGLVIFITNMFVGRAMGAIIASAIVLLDIVIKNAFPNYMYRFSPVSMARLTVLDPSGLSARPTTLYACIFFASGIIILGVAAVLSARKQEIQVLPPV